MTNLIKLYCTICQCHDSRFLAAKQRQSNNNCPKFTDDELITVYLWGLKQQLFKRKAIYNYTKTMLHDYFPALPSYQAFCRRLNRLSEAFRVLAEILSEKTHEYLLQDTNYEREYIIDSCPIMLAKDSRSNRAKVATEFCNFTRNAVKNQWYHGCKVHIIAFSRPGMMPVPCSMHIAPARSCDLYTARQIFMNCAPIQDGKLYADRAYISASWKEDLKNLYHVDVETPRKKKPTDYFKGGDVRSSTISSMRQPIESFFNWLICKTGIQQASHIRSEQGLLFHVFSALAFASLSFYFSLFYY